MGLNLYRRPSVSVHVEKNDPKMEIGRYAGSLGLSGPLRGSLRQGPIAPSVAYFLTIAYVVLEYARPQDTLPILQSFKLSLITSMLLAYVLVRFSRNVPWFRPQIVLFTLILAYMSMWVPFATNNYWALKGVVVFTQTYIFVLAIATFVDNSERLKKFVLIFIAAGLFQALWGMLHGGKGTGYFQADENDFALTMCVVLPFTLMTAAVVRERWAHLLLWTTGAMSLVAIVASDSRGGFVGLIVTAGMMVLMHRNRVRLGFATAIGAMALAVLAPSAYWEEMRTITDEGGTREDRMELWTVASDVYKDNPFFGVGQNNINWVLNDYQLESDDHRMFGGRAVHSLYYTLLPEMGTLGGLLFLGVLYYNARDIGRIVRAPRLPTDPPIDAYARALACSLMAYLICGIFLSVLWYPHFYLLTAMTIATVRVQEQQTAVAQDARVAEQNVAAEPEVPEGLESPA